MQFVFLHADKHQGFYKFPLMFLMEVARQVQSTQNRWLATFLEYKESVSAAFVFCCDAKHSDIIWGFSHVHCYLLKLVLPVTREFFSLGGELRTQNKIKVSNSYINCSMWNEGQSLVNDQTKILGDWFKLFISNHLHSGSYDTDGDIILLVTSFQSSSIALYCVFEQHITLTH